MLIAERWLELSYSQSRGEWLEPYRTVYVVAELDISQYMHQPYQKGTPKTILLIIRPVQSMAF